MSDAMIVIENVSKTYYLKSRPEPIRALDNVSNHVVDKTGTLTEGRPELVMISPVGEISEDELLLLAASIEKASEHPLAAAIVSGAESRSIKLLPHEDFESVTGQGAHATVSGRRISVGNTKLMREVGAFDESLANSVDDFRQAGQTVIFVAVDGEAAGLLGVADPVKETAAQAIGQLHRAGLKVVMLTGDNVVTANAVARQIGIDEVHADVSPGDKLIGAMGTEIPCWR